MEFHLFYSNPRICLVKSKSISVILLWVAIYTLVHCYFGYMQYIITLTANFLLIFSTCFHAWFKCVVLDVLEQRDSQMVSALLRGKGKKITKPLGHYRLCIFGCFDIKKP
jgi:hypothetical protein